MPPEMWTLIGNMGLPAFIIVWALWFFQTQAWPEVKEHLKIVATMVSALNESVKNQVEQTKALTRIADRMEEGIEGSQADHAALSDGIEEIKDLIINIPQRVGDKESA